MTDTRRNPRAHLSVSASGPPRLDTTRRSANSRQPIRHLPVAWLGDPPFLGFANDGVSMMRFRNDGGTFSTWESFASSKAWNLTSFGGTSVLGTRTVTVEVRDVAGNVTAAADSIYLYAAPASFGSACTGSAGYPVLTASGVPGVGRTAVFGVSNTQAPIGILYAGVSNTSWSGYALPLDLGQFGLAGCRVYVSLDFELRNGPPAPVPVTVPSNPVFGGITVYLQWLLLGDPSGKAVVTTQAMQVTLAGP